MGESYVPVSVESLRTDVFPDVALYLKMGDQYILYKSHGRSRSRTEASRLAENGIDFIFAGHRDLEEVALFLEGDAERALQEECLSASSKGKVICQTCVNFLRDVFLHPEKVADHARGRRLVQGLLDYLEAERDPFSPLESLLPHNDYLFVHSLRVAVLSVMLNREAFLASRDDSLDLGTGALLHDFGKAFIPRQILHKGARWAESEVEQYKKHPEEGYRYLKGVGTVRDKALSIVRYHHERNNGSGYPLGLKGDEIPPGAQIAAICDVYCTLTIDRSSRRALPPHIALQIMKQEMKHTLNERLLDVLEGIVCADPAIPLKEETGAARKGRRNSEQHHL